VRPAVDCHAPKADSVFKADLTIMVPRPETAPLVCRRLLMNDSPGAVLVPSDLVSYIHTSGDVIDETVKKRLMEATKIAFLSAGLVWIVHGLATKATCHILPVSVTETSSTVEHAETVTPPPLLHNWKREHVGSLEDWISNTSTSLETERKTLDLDVMAKRASGLTLRLVDGGVGQIYVPLHPGVPQRYRTALIWLVHQNLMHMAHGTVASELLRTFWWPHLRRDVKSIVTSCDQCQLAKGKRRKAHGNFRAVKGSAPRERWAIDFYGHPLGEVLSIIDIDSSWYEPTFLPSRAAEGVKEGILERIVFRFGIPRVIHSDDAPELIGKVVRDLEQRLGTTHRKTHGYHPEGNSVCERVHDFVGQCFRLATDDEYQRPKQLLQRIRWAWNIHGHSSLGCSPYEAMFGAPPPTSHGTLGVTESPDPASLDDIETSARAFVDLAKNHADQRRAATARTLNKKGRSKVTFKKGDLVKVFLPPNQAEAKARNRKVKHLLSWRGPCRVVDLLSPTVYRVRHVHTKRMYTRSVMNVSAWHGDEATIRDLPPRSSSSFGLDDVQVGGIIAVLDAAEDAVYSLAKVTKVVNANVHVHYLATRGKTLATAKFVLAYAKPDGRLLLRRRRKTKTIRIMDDDAAPWSGVVPLTHDLVLVPDVRLRPNGVLRTHSLRALEAVGSLLRKKHRRH